MAQPALPEVTTSYRFRVGDIECIAIKDGDALYRATEYVANAPAAEASDAVRRHGHTPDDIPSPYSGLLVRTGSNLVLIDTGAGDMTPRVGKLTANLQSEGIRPEDVDTVILTHGHPDHIGGNVDKGNVVFRNARHVMFRDEWDYWTDENNLAGLAPAFGESSRKNLLPILDQVELLDAEVSIAPGIEAIDASGHTAGHLAVAVRSGGEELLYISDAALHPIHLEHPEWHPIFDFAPDHAIAARRRLFDRAATDHSLILAMHFPPFPSLGYVTKAGGGWRWEPLALG